MGNVGSALGRLLDKAGAYVIVSDICQTNIDSAIRDFASKVVMPEDIYHTPCDVFSPCGLSNVVNNTTLRQLDCKIIAGSANVQLETPEQGQELHDKGILYAPDYVINAGGLISASLGHQGGDKKIISEKVSQIYHTLSDIFKQSKSTGLASNIIADDLARSKLYKSINQAA